jgi:tetratricopeptide (TPR) repeat protein
MKRMALAIMLAATTARAQPAQPAPEDRDAQARAAADEGAARFAQNDYAGAIAKFKEAHDLNRDPSYLFNIGQAYRHAGDCVNAADYYGRFLNEVPDPPNAEKIRAWHTSQLDCAKALAPKQDKPIAQPPPQPPSREPTAPDPERDRGGRGGITLALAGAGVAASAVGGFFLWDSRYLHRQRDALLADCTIAAPCSGGLVDDYDRRGKRANTIAIIGLAVGGIALGTSAVLFVLDRRREAAPIAIAPVPGGAVIASALTW